MDEFQIVDTTDQTTYIYALLDPNTREVRYVGKSDAPAFRFKTHLAHGTKGHSDSKDRKPTAKNKWIATLYKSGKQPLLAILEVVQNTPTEWGRAEQRWIERLVNEGHALLNTQVLNAHRSNERIFQDALDLGQELFDTNL